MFQLSGVTKTFGNVVAVRSLDLPVAAGATTVLIGPSGCGKSTVIRLLNGLLSPDDGSVTFDGEAVTPQTSLRLRRRIGYVIQEGGLFPHLTAAGNIAMMARHLGWDDARIRERITLLTDLTRFPADALSRYPAQLSGGQRQRVSLMRALMLDPDALLLDEPLGALDPMVRYDLQAELRDIFRTLGKTVVMVTHDLAEAAFFGDRIVLMRDGEIAQQGTMDDLLAAPAGEFVERFVRVQRGLSESLG